jgi:BirA family transcriptional regulator, biotin operon repressor / biotin---[acetyl-CoA-carboxylase] ligase
MSALETAVAAALQTSVIGRRLLYYPEVTSTNEVARREADRGAAEGTVVLAERQNAARGRLCRGWSSPEGSISLSVVLRPEPAQFSRLTMMAALAVMRAVKETTGLQAELKWPNDVLLGGKKISGILAESGTRANRLRHAVLGIGVNVNLSVSDYPEIPPTATSLLEETGGEVPVASFVVSILNTLERLYLHTDRRAILKEWQEHLVTLGKKVTATSGQHTVTGIAESVNEEGSLRLRLPDGTITEVIAGDVTLRLPADDAAAP